jgi:hypothetical protein
VNWQLSGLWVVQVVDVPDNNGPAPGGLTQALGASACPEQALRKTQQSQLIKLWTIPATAFWLEGGCALARFGRRGVRLRLPSFRSEDHGVGRARHRLKGHNMCGVVRVRGRIAAIVARRPQTW